ncbi:hypothetical protein GGR57DRAFT_475708 [Xylariaceae sp. FL1272]|nr:hypothetical protein GGR57DRAFT_475708 [Xylariaceae sp. FL1272]
MTFSQFAILPTELRWEIWSMALQSNARRRLVAEQNLRIFPTLDLVASPLFSVNSESREAARVFYRVRVEVFRRTQHHDRPDATGVDPLDYRGVVYLSPELDAMISMHPRTEIRGPSDLRFFGNLDPGLEFDHSDRSKVAAWGHWSADMGEETRARFRRTPNHWCLLTQAARRQTRVQDWAELRDWVVGFGPGEERRARELLKSMRINTWEFAQVFGWY